MTYIINLLNSKKTNIDVAISGWVKTCRSSKSVSFISLNDGSTINNIQVVAFHSY